MLPTSLRVSRGHRRLAPGITQVAPRLQIPTAVRDAEEWWSFDHSAASSEDHSGARASLAIERAWRASFSEVRGMERLRRGRARTNVSLGLTRAQPKRRCTGTLDYHKRCPIHWPAANLSRCL